MRRTQSGAERGRTGRGQRYGSLAVLIVLCTAFLVARTGPAHAALTPCPDPAVCPIGADDFYIVPFGQKLTVPAATGVLANDFGPPGTRIEFTDDCTDTTSWWTDASFNVKATDGSFTYVPAPPTDIDYPYSGLDQLAYCIIDPATGNDDETPVVNIAVVPTVRDDSYGTKTNVPLTVNATFDPKTGLPTSGLVGNDSGIDSSTLSLDSTSAAGGTVDDNFDGSFVYTPPLNFHGIDTFHYTGEDFDADWVDGPMDPFNPDPAKATVPMHGTVTIYVDGTPPTAAMIAPISPVTLSTNVPASWTGHDDQGVANYDMQYTNAPWNGVFKPWTMWRSATTATSATIAGTYGRTFCFQVRARDHAGNVSPFTPSRCSAVPLRAASLVYSRLWTRPASAAYFSGEAFRTVYNGQTATRTGVSGKHLWLVATKCSTCGGVQVRLNGALIASASLASPTTVHRALIPIGAFTTVRTGTLSITVTSATGKQVIIEGLAVLRA